MLDSSKKSATTPMVKLGVRDVARPMSVHVSNRECEVSELLRDRDFQERLEKKMLIRALFCN